MQYLAGVLRRRLPIRCSMAFLLAVSVMADANAASRYAHRTSVPHRFQGWVSVEPRRWPVDPAEKTVALPLPPVRPQAAPAGPLPPAAASDCVASLAREGIVAAPAAEPPQAASGPACTVDEPVRLTSVGPVHVAGEPLLSCAMAQVFGTFLRDLAVPLATGAQGSALRAVAVGGGFECRPRNHVAGAKPSAHGKGIAVDVLGFTFADGRTLSITHDSGEPFLRAFRLAACGAFTTVLGPGADAAHATNLHLDIEKHGSSDRYRICE